MKLLSGAEAEAPTDFVPDPNPEDASGGNDNDVTAWKGKGVPSIGRDIGHLIRGLTGERSPVDRTLVRMTSIRRGLGVLGGTFDPPHIGHIAAAVEVRSALCLDQVILMVANEPWQKVHQRAISPAEDRLALTQAAVVGIEGVEVSDLEIRRGGPTYSVDTLSLLRQNDASCELFLIVGADAAAGLSTWHRYEELPEMATLVIVDRSGENPTDLPAGWNVERVTMPRLDISSSELRDRVQKGGALSPYLAPGVIDEIIQRGLYGLAES